MIIRNDIATAPSKFPIDISRKTLVDKTSVLPRVAPANTNIGPNSPKDLAQARIPEVIIPNLA